MVSIERDFGSMIHMWDQDIPFSIGEYSISLEPRKPKIEILEDKILLNGVDILEELFNIQQRQTNIERYFTLQLLEKKIPITDINKIILEYLQ